MEKAKGTPEKADLRSQGESLTGSFFLVANSVSHVYSAIEQVLTIFSVISCILAALVWVLALVHGVILTLLLLLVLHVVVLCSRHVGLRCSWRGCVALRPFLL